MTTPLVTVANSIIEFILSLLRDPAALAELEEDPEAAMAKHKVAGICADDVRAVAPIIYDRPDIVPRSTPATPSTHNNDVLNEITRITNNWTTIDSRSTIVDQSVNQNIWTEGGDVTQIFDQTAGVASGDGSMAAGDDIGVDAPTDDADEGPTLSDLPGVPPDVDGLDGFDEGQNGLPVGDDADGTTGSVADDDAQSPGVPTVPPAPAADAANDAVAVADGAAEGAEQPASPVYETPAAEVDDAVWSEPADAVPVEEVVYHDDLGEEQ